MDTILLPIMWVIAWIMDIIHRGLTAIGLADGAGSAWVWSIVGLTVVVRILILPLFKKQINSSRAQQLIQPELKKLQKKYKGKKDTYSQQRMQAESRERIAALAEVRRRARAGLAAGTDDEDGNDEDDDGDTEIFYAP